LNFDIICQLSLVDNIVVDAVAMAKYLLITAAVYSLRQLGLTCLFLFAESVVTSQSHSSAEPSQLKCDEPNRQPDSAVCYTL